MQIRPKNFSELCPKDTVDQQVDGGVQQEEDRGDEAEDEDPDREAAKIWTSAEVHFLHHIYFMHVENYTQYVANKEGDDDHHKDPGEAVLLSYPVQ